MNGLQLKAKVQFSIIFDGISNTIIRKDALQLVFI